MVATHEKLLDSGARSDQRIPRWYIESMARADGESGCLPVELMRLLRNRIALLLKKPSGFAPCFIFARDRDVAFDFVHGFLRHQVVRKHWMAVFAPATSRELVRGLEHFLMTGGARHEGSREGARKPLFVDASCLFDVRDIASLEFMFGKISRHVGLFDENCPRGVVFLLPSSFLDNFPTIASPFWKRKGLFSVI